MPPKSEQERYVGRWLNRENGYTADLAIENGKLVGRTWGAAFPLRATEDGRLIASHSARDFVIRLSADGDTLDVEADAATHAVFHRAPAEPVLPEDLPGRYESAELDAVWSITPREGGLMRARADGPVVRGGEMRVEPIDGDFIRVVVPRALFDAWNDVRVLRDKAGRISGLHVDGGRARGLVFTRAPIA
jgi:hypothetical protein